MSYEGPWRNRTHQLYEQFCYPDEAPKKLMGILEKFGKCFDDNWQYHIAGRSKKVVVRRPLWINHTLSGREVEKGHTQEDQFQTRLLEKEIAQVE